jgi:hypothetical protein
MSSEKVLNVKTGKLENCTVGAGCQRHAHNLSALSEINEDKLGLSTRWYVYDQNNSGGSFAEPAQYLIIQAKDFNEANSLAIEAGAYFDDSYESDCSCCGQRWYSKSSDELDQYSVFKTEGEAVGYVKEHDPFDKEIPFYMVIN